MFSNRSLPTVLSICNIILTLLLLTVYLIKCHKLHLERREIPIFSLSFFVQYSVLLHSIGLSQSSLCIVNCSHDIVFPIGFLPNPLIL